MLKLFGIEINRFLKISILVAFIIIFLILFTYFGFISPYVSLDFIHPSQSLNASVGQTINLTFNVSCFSNVCGEISLGLFLKDKDYICVANDDAGLDVYSIDDSGNLEFIDNDFINEGSALSVFGDGNFIYLANGALGIDIYTLDNSGSLNHLLNSPLRSLDGYSYGIFADDNFIYVANGNVGIDVYTLDDSGNLEFIDNASINEGSALSVFKEDNLLYVAGAHAGIYVYSVDNLGHLEFTEHINDGFVYNIWGDGNFIYVATDQNGITVYSVNESGQLTFRDNDYIDGYSYGVFADDNFIYVANGYAGIYVYSVNEFGELSYVGNSPLMDPIGEAYNIWGDGDFIYLADGEHGIDVYSVDEDGQLSFIDNDFIDGYSNSICGDLRTGNQVLSVNESTIYSTDGDYKNLTLESGESKLINFSIKVTGNISESYYLFAQVINVDGFTKSDFSEYFKITIVEPENLLEENNESIGGDNESIEEIAQEENISLDESSSSLNGGLGSGIKQNNDSLKQCFYDINYDWECSEWSNCSEGIQTRQCKEYNNCDDTFGRPRILRNCDEKIIRPKELFDMKLDINRYKFEDLSQLEFYMGLESFGSVPTLVTLNYSLLNQNKEVLSSYIDEVVVETEKVVSGRFSDIIASQGNYSIVVKTVYGDNVSDEFRKDFEIVKEKINYFSYFIIIPAVILFFTIIYFILFYRNRKKGAKK